MNMLGLCCCIAFVCHQVYTSGKGSSAAGLTVSVTRDPVTVGPRIHNAVMPVSQT